MTLRNDLTPYIDSDGFVMPALNTPSTNGVMYTSEALIARIRNGEATPLDSNSYILSMLRCMRVQGLLQRDPENTGGQESVDDYYGLAAAADEIGTAAAVGMVRSSVNYAMRHLGSMDNLSPGRWQWSAFLVRQPTLDAVMLWAAGDFVGPVLRTIMTLSIMWNSLFPAPTSDTTSWRLQWLQVQVARRHSLSSRLASILWYKRLYGVWGPSGMKAVNSVYFQPTHPLAIWAVDKA